MNTRTIESNTSCLAVPGQSNRTLTAFRPPALEGQKLSAEMNARSFPAFPDGPELWRLYQQQANSHTENDLVECYLPLVRSILNRLAATLPESVDRDDLHSAGVLGLLGALRKFNPAAGVPFDSYARQRIRGAMLDEMRHMDWVPRAIHAKSKELQRTVSQLEKQLGRTPAKSEKAAAMKMTVAQFDELLVELRPVQFLRLDATSETDQEGESFLSEVIANPDQIDPMEQVSSLELRQVIFERLKQMPEIQRKVLTLYFIEGMYLREIGEVLGLTDGRICQIQTQAISSLRNYLKRYESGMASPDEPALPMKQRGKKPTVQTQSTGEKS